MKNKNKARLLAAMIAVSTFLIGYDYCRADSFDIIILGVPLKTILERILKLVLRLIGEVALLLLIASGVLYAVSNGDPQRQQKAKNMAIYIIEGLVIILASWSILNLIDTLLVRP